MTDDYQPVSCQLHSEIELFATRANTVTISTGPADAPITGRILDISIHDKAEFLVIREENGETSEIRLDHIQKITT